MHAHQASGHLPVAAPHAFVVVRPATVVDTSAHAIRRSILTSHRVRRGFRRRAEQQSDAYDREEKVPSHLRTSLRKVRESL
jgi:hypothetical protein